MTDGQHGAPGGADPVLAFQALLPVSGGAENLGHLGSRAPQPNRQELQNRLGGELPPSVRDELHGEPRAPTMSGSLGFQRALSQALAGVCSIHSCFGVHCKPEEIGQEKRSPQVLHAGPRPSFSR